MGVHSINIGKSNLPIYEIETLVRKHEYAFEAFGAVTIGIYNKNNDIYYTQRQAWSFSTDVNHVHISDLARRKQFRVGVVGVSPGLIDAIERDNIKLRDHHSQLTRFNLDSESTLLEKLTNYFGLDKDARTLGEQLYSEEGLHSVGVSKYIYDQLNLDLSDKDSGLLLDVHSEKWGNKFYELMPAFSLSIFGGLEFKDSML
jgi:hypothetical protein